MDSRFIGLALVAAMVCWAAYRIFNMNHEKKGRPVRPETGRGNTPAGGVP